MFELAEIFQQNRRELIHITAQNKAFIFLCVGVRTCAYGGRIKSVPLFAHQHAPAHPGYKKAKLA